MDTTPLKAPPFPSPSFRSEQGWWGRRDGGVPLSVLCACNPCAYGVHAAHRRPVRRERTQPGVPCGWLAGHGDRVCRGHMDSTPTNWIGGFTGQGESRGAMQGARPSRTPLRGLAQAGLVDRIGSSHGRLPRVLLGRVADRPPCAYRLGATLSTAESAVRRVQHSPRKSASGLVSISPGLWSRK